MSNHEQNHLPEIQMAGPSESTISSGLKRAIRVIGLLLVIVGLPVAINLFCIVPLVLYSGGDSDAIIYGVVSLIFALLTLGVGGAALLHANRSLQNKPSKVLLLPPPMLFVAIFIF